jgi:hypothetical protein
LKSYYGDLGKIAGKNKYAKRLKSIGFTKRVGRPCRIDSTDNCLESDKENLRDILKKDISYISKFVGDGVAS